MQTNNLPAMSLLELLIVMVIAAVLLGLGLGSLITLRNQTTVRNSASEFAQNLKSVRNDARNGVLIGKDPNNEQANIAAVDALDFFSVRVQDDEYYRTTCDDDVNLSCQPADNSLKSGLYDVVDIIPVDTSTGQEDSANCSAILMDLATGRFSFATLNGDTLTKNQTQECEYVFRHSQTAGLNEVTVTVTSGVGDIIIE